MTEYDYSPGAWEQHLAKQARIAEWTAQSSKQQHEYTSPFKPSDDELTRAKESQFYGAGEAYDGPDRPPTPTPGGSAGVYYAYGSGAAGPSSGSTPGGVAPQMQYGQVQAQAAVVASTSARVLVPRWTGSAWVYETYQPPVVKISSSGVSRREHSSSSSTAANSVRSGKSKGGRRPGGPVKSYSMPVYYTAMYPSGTAQQGQQQQQQFQWVQQQAPVSAGTTVGSGSYVGYVYPTVVVDGATKKTGNKLKKKDKDATSFFGRISG